jgi:hypothetical protein
MKRKEPASFQELVTPLFHEQKKEAHLTLTTVRSRWAEIVGPDLAAKCHPMRVHRGVLWVAAPDASWAYQFQFMRSEVMQCLQSVLGQTDIHEVRFKAGAIPAAAEQPAPDDLKPSPLPELSADDPLARAAAAIPDAGMRALFMRSLAKQRQNRMRRAAEGANAATPTEAGS